MNIASGIEDTTSNTKTKLRILKIELEYKTWNSQNKAGILKKK